MNGYKLPLPSFAFAAPLELISGFFFPRASFYLPYVNSALYDTTGVSAVPDANYISTITRLQALDAYWNVKAWRIHGTLAGRTLDYTVTTGTKLATDGVTDVVTGTPTRRPKRLRAGLGYSPAGTELTRFEYVETSADNYLAVFISIDPWATLYKDPAVTTLRGLLLEVVEGLTEQTGEDPDTGEFFYVPQNRVRESVDGDLRDTVKIHDSQCKFETDPAETPGPLNTTPATGNPISSGSLAVVPAERWATSDWFTGPPPP